MSHALIIFGGVKRIAAFTNAVVPFIWRSYREGSNLDKLRTGVRDMPNHQERLKAIGREIAK